MKKTAWKKKIRAACEEAGTYRPFFEHAIDTLASILEKRDEAEAQYIETGAQPVIIHKNAARAENMAKNPALIMWDELNKSALAYWRDLGLTPAGLKKIDEDSLKKKKRSGLAEALRDIGG